MNKLKNMYLKPTKNIIGASANFSPLSGSYHVVEFNGSTLSSSILQLVEQPTYYVLYHNHKREEGPP